VFSSCVSFHNCVDFIFNPAVKLPGMLTILMQTIVNTNNNILAKITANTNTNAFVTILFCFYIQQRSFFCGHLLIKLIK